MHPRLAEAQGYVHEVLDQVWETDVLTHRIWTGADLADWAVVRPQVERSIKQAAIENARELAGREGVIFHLDPFSLSPTKEDNSRYYCSKLVWRAYLDAPGGPNLQRAWGMGGILPSLFYVSPDDLYFSSHQVQSADVGGWGIGRFLARIWSPAHITLVDPVGRRTGYDPVLGSVSEIPGAAYYAPPEALHETMTANNAGEGWQIIVTGYDDGEFVLEHRYLASGTMISAASGTTTIGQTDVYPVFDPQHPIYLPLTLQ